MLSSKPCTTTCVIDDVPVTLTFYPDSCDLRVCDAGGDCIVRTKWHDSWTALLSVLRGVAHSPATELHDMLDAISSRRPADVAEAAIAA
jgi:hypothetical protein